MFPCKQEYSSSIHTSAAIEVDCVSCIYCFICLITNEVCWLGHQSVTSTGCGVYHSRKSGTHILSNHQDPPPNLYHHIDHSGVHKTEFNNHSQFHLHEIMKSTKVQNPRCIPHIAIKPIMRAYWPPIAVQLLTGQYSLLRRLAASCIVWDKAEPAIRTILHDALNRQSGARTAISSVTQSRLPGGWVTKL